MLALAPLPHHDATPALLAAGERLAAWPPGQLALDGPAVLAGLAEPFELSARPATLDHDRLAVAAGLEPARDLLQLRRPLPAPPPPTIELRAFRPGADDEAWLEVNRRAFAWHPEQGDWGPEDLAAGLTSGWFDPEGFLVHDDGGRLVGSCWTKVHEASGQDPALGEIFVISVDPDAHGRGLGRALVLAGLDHLARRGLTVGMLYTEADNAPARALYERLGFVVHERHRWWRRPATRC